MNEKDLKVIPYTATSLSVVGRFIFMFLILFLQNKFTLNPLSIRMNAFYAKRRRMKERT